MNFRFQSKLALFFTILFAIVQIATILIAFAVSRDSISDQMAEQLRYTSSALRHQIGERSRILQNETEILSRDYGFRAAVATGDAETVRSALRSLDMRVETDRLTVFSASGKLIADTGDSVSESEEFRQLLSMDQKRHKYLTLDGELYEYVLIPVMAPDLIGWVGAGNHIDKTLAEKLQQLLPGKPQISFLVLNGHGVAGIPGSTLPGEVDWVRQFSAYLDLLQLENVYRFQGGGEDYLTTTVYIDMTDQGAQLIGVLQFPMIRAGFYANRVAISYLFVLLAGLTIALIGAILIARNLSRPVKDLAQAAERIESGNYSEPVEVSRTDEFGCLAGYFNDMAAAIKQREQRIQQQAHFDALTGLPNRLFYETRLSKLILEDSDNIFAVVLVTVERFQDINNLLGHEVGDRVIEQIGLELPHVVKGSDTTARIGSDTFALVLPGVGRGETPSVVERILSVFGRSVSVSEVDVDVGAHLGVAYYPEHGVGAVDLLRLAERASFNAMHEAARYQVYDEGSDSADQRNISLMGELRDAIDQEQLELYYQPQLLLGPGDHVRVESLVRWNHPDDGLLTPDRFIPLAEQTGEIARVTEWVLEKSIAQLDAWGRQGIRIAMSVNLAARDLLNRQLPTLISELLHKYDVEPERLCLEITESDVMRDPERVIGVLKAIRGYGVDVAIDDFGTGYSSLAYLAQLPVTELKIDKSFVLNLASDDTDQIIVRSSIDIAHRLGMRVVAEGIEDLVTLEILLAQGCDLGQGYFIARPMPAQAFVEWLEQEHKVPEGEDDPVCIEA